MNVPSFFVEAKEFLRVELRIDKMDGIDSTGHSGASVFKPRPDIAGRLYLTQAGLVDHPEKMPTVDRNAGAKRIK